MSESGKAEVLSAEGREPSIAWGAAPARYYQFRSYSSPSEAAGASQAERDCE